MVAPSSFETEALIVYGKDTRSRSLNSHIALRALFIPTQPGATAKTASTILAESMDPTTFRTII